MAICRGGCGGSCDSDHSAQSIFCFGLACKNDHMNIFTAIPDPGGKSSPPYSAQKKCL